MQKPLRHMWHDKTVSRRLAAQVKDISIYPACSRSYHTQFFSLGVIHGIMVECPWLRFRWLVLFHLDGRDLGVLTIWRSF